MFYILISCLNSCLYILITIILEATFRSTHVISRGYPGCVDHASYMARITRILKTGVSILLSSLVPRFHIFCCISDFIYS